jgi:4'-phosphopantetheinyl transferase
MNPQFELGELAIDLWPIRISSAEAEVASWQTLLSREEQHRVAGLRFDHLKRSFIVSHGLLRGLLGLYLNIEPAKVQIRYSANGKPYIAKSKWLKFNVSHSNGIVLFAVTRDCEIGVDLEQTRGIPEMLEIAQQFFCPGETSKLRSLPVHQRERAFYQCWTRKEAYIKATGEGLSIPLNSFQVTLGPDDPARFVHIGQDRELARSWTLADVELVGSYTGALAYHGPPRLLRRRRLVDPLMLLESE